MMGEITLFVFFSLFISGLYAMVCAMFVVMPAYGSEWVRGAHDRPSRCTPYRDALWRKRGACERPRIRDPPIRMKRVPKGPGGSLGRGGPQLPTLTREPSRGGVGGVDAQVVGALFNFLRLTIF